MLHNGPPPLSRSQTAPRTLTASGNHARSAALVAGLLVLSCFGCGEPDGTADEQPAVTSINQWEPKVIQADAAEAVAIGETRPGTHLLTITRSDGTPVRFTLVIPDEYDAGRPWPLVVALHFGGPVTPHFGRGVIEALVGPAFAELSPVIVAPDSVSGRWTNDTNEQAVLQVVHSVLKSLNIDERRILLTGFSLGGEGTFYIGGRNQDLFRMAIPVAGRPTSDATWTIPVFAVHSRADTVVPCEPTEKYIEQLRASGVDARIKVVSDIPHFNTPAFVPALRSTLPWIREYWTSAETGSEQ